MLSNYLGLWLCVLALASAAPAGLHMRPLKKVLAVPKVQATTNNTITAECIEAIAPDTASCSGAQFPDECADASAAAVSINKAIAKYGVTNRAEQAAALAVMLYESGDFKFNKNHYPGVVGQGTKNMQSPAYNTKYADSLYDAATVQQASSSGPAAVLQLVGNNDDSFGSAFWFIATQCTPTIRQGLQAGTQAGWSAYLTQCIGTTDTADRDAIWTKAIAELKTA